MVSQQEWLRQAAFRLSAVGIEDGEFDARCLLETFGNLPHGQTPSEKPMDALTEEKLNEALMKRATGTPLQYVLGEWDFLFLTLSVGEGVLIPRPETELLCETAVKVLQGDNPAVLDLCAGSGCVGLGIAGLYPTAQVTALELSPKAMGYLKANTERYPHYAVTPVQGDVFTDAPLFDEKYQLIVSNPPYIPTEELRYLQREVQREPRLALDGDTDGLKFYRCLAEEWSRKLVPGGWLMVEVGIRQSEAVEELFRRAGLVGVESIPDYSGIPRVVKGQKPAK